VFDLKKLRKMLAVVFVSLCLVLGDQRSGYLPRPPVVANRDLQSRIRRCIFGMYTDLAWDVSDFPQSVYVVNRFLDIADRVTLLESGGGKVDTRELIRDIAVVHRTFCVRAWLED
jgi:hypothetical protein